MTRSEEYVDAVHRLWVLAGIWASVLTVFAGWFAYGDVFGGLAALLALAVILSLVQPLNYLAEKSTREKA